MRELKEEKVKSVKVDIQNRRFTATLSEIARQTQVHSAAELAKTQLESVTTMQEGSQSMSELQIMEYQQSLRANSQRPSEKNPYYTTASKLGTSVYSNSGSRALLMKSVDK